MELLGNRYIKICQENKMCFINYISICQEVAEKEIKERIECFEKNQKILNNLFETIKNKKDKQ